MFVLNESNLSGLNDYLLHKGWLPQDERVFGITKPGEGNMNCVLRLTTNLGSYIIKQSRDYVEKYPQVAAPKERAKSEAAFYHCIKQYPFLMEHTPALLRVDNENNILLIEDLGNSNDYTFLYAGKKQLEETDAQILSTFLSELHGTVIKNNNPLLQNTAMKNLNHEHIFVYPFMENNGLDLGTVTEGLQAVSLPYKTDDVLKEKAGKLGLTYLEEGNYLLHGDFYPGSWLSTNGGIKVIDPEFCFYGYAEFDVGVMLAHCYLSEQPQNTIDAILKAYKKRDDLNLALLNQFIGIEIMRRILGLAQLPLVATLKTKQDLLQKGYELIMS
ncbi:MAG: phosphotransferase [Ferruginibacter sp.]